jgi:riboflavin kinase / FMN adenylyltransferase
MDIIRDISKITLDCQCSVVTIGNFDGIHLAHQAILKKVREEARRRGCRAVVITFEPHPQSVLQPDRRPFFLITTLEEKLRLIEQLGIDAVIVIEFTLEFSKMKAEEFVRAILWDRLHVRKIFIGHDTAFGNRKEGNEEFVRVWGRRLGYDVEVTRTVQIGDLVVSSTRVRDAILGGDVGSAFRLLGRPYNVSGSVIKGLQRGSEIGIPTANIEPQKELIPARGVYAVRVALEGRTYRGVLNIGYNPTFQNEQLSMEVHLLDFKGDLYDRILDVQFIQRIRDEMKFESPAKLVEQIRRDIETARLILETEP